MGFFGFGTIVSLSVLSVLSVLMHALGLGRVPRQASGALLLLFAVWTALPIVQSTGHGH